MHLWFVDSCHKTAGCQQGKKESVLECTQCYAQTFMLYGGYEVSSVSDVLGSRVPVSQWADGLKSDLPKVLPIQLKSIGTLSSYSTRKYRHPIYATIDVLAPYLAI